MINFNIDIFSRSFAEANFMMHLSSNMINIVVNHGKSDKYRKYGNYRKSNSRIGNKFISLKATVPLHILY